jgi:hypothetical protein
LYFIFKLRVYLNNVSDQRCILNDDYVAPTSFCRPLVVIDFGLSIGNPRALSQTSDAITPKARDTPNNTV